MKHWNGLVLAFLVLIAPILIGGTPDGPRVLLEVCALLLPVGWILDRFLARRGDRASAGSVAGHSGGTTGEPVWKHLAFPLLLLVGLAVLQLIPIPRSILGTVAPGWDSLLSRVLPSGPPASGWRPLSVAPGQSLDAVLLLLACAAVFWAAARSWADNSSPEPSVRILAWIALSGAVTATIGFAQRATWNGRILWIYEPIEWAGVARAPDRVSGPFVNPDHFAAFLLLAFFASLALLFALREASGAVTRHRRIPLRALAAGTIPLAIAGILASGSRAVFFATSVGGVLALLLARRRARKARAPVATRRARAIVAGIVVSVSAAVFLFVARENVLDMAERWVGLLFVPGAASSGLARISAWRSTLSMIAGFPQGVGPGCWSVVYPLYATPPNHRLVWSHAHSDLIEVLAEVGVLGAAIVLAGAIRFLRDTSAPDWKIPHELPPFARTILAIGLAAFLFPASVDFPLRTPACAIAFAALAGTCLRRRRYAADRGWKGGSNRARAGEAGEAPGNRTGSRTEWRSGAAVAGGVALNLWVVGLALSQLFPSLDFLRFERYRSVERDLASAWSVLPKPEPGQNVPPEAIDAAAAIFRRAIERSPASRLAHHGLALTTRDPAEGMREMGIAVALDPTSAFYHDQMAMLLLGQRREAEAADHVEQALFYNPSIDMHAYLAPGASAWLGPRLVEAAERGLEKARRASGMSELAGVELARFLQTRGEFSKQGAVLEALASERGAGDATYLLKAARAYWRANAPEGAARTERAFRQRNEGEGPSVDVDLALQVYVPAGDLARAEEILAEAEGRHGPSGEIEMARGKVAMARRDWAAARDAFRRATMLAPNEAEAQFMLGEAHRNLGELADALRAFEKAASLGLTSETVWIRLGDLHEQRREYRQAVEQYRKALRLEPGDPAVGAKLSRAEALARGENPDAPAGPVP